MRRVENHRKYCDPIAFMHYLCFVDFFQFFRCCCSGSILVTCCFSVALFIETLNQSINSVIEILCDLIFMCTVFAHKIVFATMVLCDLSNRNGFFLQHAACTINFWIEKRCFGFRILFCIYLNAIRFPSPAFLFPFFVDTYRFWWLSSNESAHTVCLRNLKQNRKKRCTKQKRVSLFRENQKRNGKFFLKCTLIIRIFSFRFIFIVLLHAQCSHVHLFTD